ncbi:MAG: hypothetical protein HQK77_10215 [Desulfobacterales bacterium]|nr:hypothetical protein [Desulfobacterales bacterium]
MVQLAVSGVIFITKALVRHHISHAIADGVSEAKYEVDKKTTRTLVSSLMNMTINIFLLIAAVYISPFFLDHFSVTFLVSSIYLSSIIYSCYSVLMNARPILKFIFSHKLNLKDYVHDEIYKEALTKAHIELNKRNVFVRIINSFYGKSASEIASDIANQTTMIVLRKVTVIAMMITTVIVVNSLIFRMMVAPAIIKNVTDFNMFQAALYPIALSVDYFFYTNLVSLIV